MDTHSLTHSLVLTQIQTSNRCNKNNKITPPAVCSCCYWWRWWANRFCFVVLIFLVTNVYCNNNGVCVSVEHCVQPTNPATFLFQAKFHHRHLFIFLEAFHKQTGFCSAFVLASHVFMYIWNKNISNNFSPVRFLGTSPWCSWVFLFMSLFYFLCHYCMPKVTKAKVDGYKKIELRFRFPFLVHPPAILLLCEQIKESTFDFCEHSQRNPCLTSMDILSPNITLDSLCIEHSIHVQWNVCSGLTAEAYIPFILAKYSEFRTR